MSEHELQRAAAVAAEWVAAWNRLDLEAILGHYADNVHFASPRVAAAFGKTGGQVGSADGVLLGTEQLRPYFQQAIDTLSTGLRLDLKRVLQGPPGWHAIVYCRETGAEVVECFQLGREGGGPAEGKITAVQVFYDAVC